MRPIITLLTDFGTADGYVGEIKGVLLTRLPDAQLIDITHDVPPQDVESGRLVLARTWRRFPAGTVHVVVVDPGVGSERAALAVCSDGRFLVGPDNGVLSPALLLARGRCTHLSRARSVRSSSGRSGGGSAARRTRIASDGSRDTTHAGGAASGG